MALRQLATRAGLHFGFRAQFPAVEAGNLSWSCIAQRAFASVPSGFKFAPSHEWAKIEGDTATIGISDHAQAELGDVVYVELPEVGASFNKGDTFGVVESVKAASDVYIPVGGEVVERNQALVDEPAKVNGDAYGAWMVKIKLSNPSDADDLLDTDAYKKHIDQ